MDLDVLAAWQTTVRDLTRPSIRIDDLSRAWELVTSHLDPETIAQHESYLLVATRETKLATRQLEQAGMLDELLEYYLDSLRNAFHLVESLITAHLDALENAGDCDKFETMLAMLDAIGNSIHRWQSPINAIWSENPTALSSYRKTFLSALYHVMPPRFAPCLQTFLKTLLTLPDPTATPAAREYALAFPTLITLLDRYDPLLFALIYEEIEARTVATCRGNFREKQLDGLLKWLNGAKGEGVMGWITGIYEGNSQGAHEDARKFLKPTFSRFEYHVHKTLCQLRTTELFDIILDYPNSKPALEDLKLCLNKTDNRALLVSRLRQQLNSRLLHPGSDTKDIVTLYISTIRCLRIVDPPGVLLSRVADPIRRYLRARKDTIRCIVSSLIEQGNPLFEELTTSDAKLVSDAKDEAENYTDQKWMPDPADAPADFRKSKGADVIQLLVSIYDTKEVFVKELQVLLAQRLLAIRDYSFATEIENVATLKGRFGEQSLQGCDVMLKDLEDSHKIDQGVHAASPTLPLHATVVSRLFWPSFQSAPLKLPGQLGRVHSAYDRTFSKLKADKKLKWMPQLGNVNLTIELRDRTVTVDATPVQAAVLELFDKQDTWASEALQTELRLTDLATVRNALFFWNNLGIVRIMAREDGELWRLVEDQILDGEDQFDQIAHVIEEEKEAVQSVEEQGVAQMRVFWQFIQGMLTNLGALPIARIHTTLNMLAPGYKGKTTDELKALLEAVEAEGLVTKTASGSWKIVK
ncbi:anaphase promoting complex subunit 2 [Sporobolomyces koalae]|uniref:anaphase promoting complex subunit 2 n=1 Tax=Sporobolomyces koalae TaxID=500713 RepID=UPI00317B10BD